MNKLLLCVLCVLALFAAVAPCFADTVNGVLAEDRVVNLPNDQGKWYISVVGNANNARYVEVLGWFDSNPSLARLKDQVHFCPVTSDTAIYTERYAPNIKGLPTVRMQKADGTVVYEAAGKDIPMTAGGLNGALAAAVNEARGLRPILPWRRDADNRLNNLERPKPQPQPQPDPEPQPIDDGATPDLEPEVGLLAWIVAPLCCLSLLVGLGLGYGKKLIAKLKEKLTPAAK
jgi:hypothetical protein